MFPIWLLVLLIIGATWRTTRAITADFITQPFRDFIARRSGPEGRLTYLFECDYCTSFWVAPIFAWAGIYYGDNRVVLLILIALTASGVTGWLASKETP